jgi:hypothetical protein
VTPTITCFCCTDIVSFFLVPPTFFASQVASRARNHVEEQISSGRVINDPSTLCFKDYVIFC